MISSLMIIVQTLIGTPLAGDAGITPDLEARVIRTALGYLTYAP